MNVLDHITALVDAGQRGAEMKIHVSKETVLGIVRPYDDRTRVSLPNLDINICDCGIKSAGVGVRDRTVVSLRIWRASSGEKDDELLMRHSSKTRRVGGRGADQYGGTEIGGVIAPQAQLSDRGEGTR